MENNLEVLRQRSVEGGRLAESVDRLGLNAGALHEALLQVDRNQQTLAELGRELEETKANSVGKQELDQRDDAARRQVLAYRKQMLGRFYAIGLLGLSLFAAAALGAITYQNNLQTQTEEYRVNVYNICLQRSEQSVQVRRWLDYQQAADLADMDGPDRLKAQEQAELIKRAFPRISCEELKP